MLVGDFGGLTPTTLLVRPCPPPQARDAALKSTPDSDMVLHRHRHHLRNPPNRHPLLRQPQRVHRHRLRLRRPRNPHLHSWNLYQNHPDHVRARSGIKPGRGPGCRI